jgi:3-oxoacyl-[acyl-carrier protein] reductase
LDIKNNNFVITGAAQGLGEAIAISLANQGAKLALLDINAEQLDAVLARCTAAGAAECFAFTCDVADETSVLRSFAALEERLGTITGLVNNAGILRDGLLVKVKEGEIVDRLSLEQWQQVIDVNLTGVFLCGREAASSMIRNHQPRREYRSVELRRRQVRCGGANHYLGARTGALPDSLRGDRAGGLRNRNGGIAETGGA